MNAQDHEAIAGIYANTFDLERQLRMWITQDFPEPPHTGRINHLVPVLVEKLTWMFANALADYLAAEQCGCCGATKDTDSSYCADCHVCEGQCDPHPNWFDRAVFIAACYGETAHQDNATPGPG